MKDLGLRRREVAFFRIMRNRRCRKWNFIRISKKGGKNLATLRIAGNGIVGYTLVCNPCARTDSSRILLHFIVGIVKRSTMPAMVFMRKEKPGEFCGRN